MFKESNIQIDEIIKIDIREFSVPNIFTPNDIDEIKGSYSAISIILPKIDNYFRFTIGVEFDSNMLIATAEFNTNNLEFLTSNFSFTNENLAKLLNAFMTLLNLRERNSDQFNSTFESKNIYSMHGSQSNMLKKRELEIDFCSISKKRLLEFKVALVKLKLINPSSFSNIQFLNLENEQNKVSRHKMYKI